jgi:hypothetical protein
MYSMET